ncbi:MAG TPA: DUF4038 domain-containing protein [Candidatus Saccharimonadales bacterium]|nr:DUF4038 domain-containing protein [Candidatus Saccharimonadales bacterium]
MFRNTIVNLFRRTSVKFYLGFAAALAIGGAGFVFATPAPTNLVAHWSYDQSGGAVLADDSGNGHTGTISGSPTFSAGRINNGLTLKGTDNVALGNITQIDGVSKLTLATWMKRTSAGAKVLVGKQATNQDVAIEAYSDGKLYFQLSKGADTYGSITLNDTAWHHVALVFDGTLTGNANRLKAYVDGVQKTLTFNGTVGTSTTTNTTAFNIGKVSGEYSAGQVDDTWLYARALSQVEVQDLMQGNTIDTTAPSVPANLNANAVSQSQVNLSWSASTDNVGVTGYRVYRGGVALGTTTSTSYQDTGLAAGTSYTYTVRAYDAAGNTSADSTAATATTLTPDTTAPTVSLTAPVDASTVSGTIAVSANASDNVAVTSVAFAVDGVQQGANDTTAPYGISLNTTALSNGTHTVRATAYDAAGNAAYNEVTVTVDNQPDTTAPAVVLTAPADGSTISGTATLSANATDNVGVAGVKFYAGSTQVGTEVTAAPYNVSWNTTAVANGPVQLTAVARDAAGNTTTSTAITVTVNNVVPSTKFVSGISSNHRYFVDQTGAPVLVKGDSPWAMVSDLSATQVEQWATNREGHGFNAAILSLIGNPTNGGPAASGATYDGIQPFNNGNITSFNETYWSRMDNYLTILKNHGITAFLYPMDGWNTLSGSIFSGKSTADCYTYGRMVATRYASYPNIVWMVGGDYNGYSNTVNAQFQNLLSGIRSTGDQRIFSAQLNNETLTTDVDFYEGLANWNFAYTYTPTYEKILRGYDRAPSTRDPRPILLGEANYEGEDNYGGPATTTETLRRQQIWTLTSGGAGEFTGSQDWQFQSGWETRLDTAWVSQAQKMRNFFSGLNWQLLVPDEANPVVTAGRGTKLTTDTTLDVLQNDYVTAAQTPDKSQTVIYVPTNTGNTNARTITLDLTKLPAGFTATWVDPTDATSTQTAVVDASGNVTTPGLHGDNTRDWLLYIHQ